MLSALERKFGSVGSYDLLGVGKVTWMQWRKHKREPNMAARKAVWLIWALALHPEQVTSLWDIATYGRFHGQQMIEPEPDYEI
jgi:hypothetical protein